MESLYVRLDTGLDGAVVAGPMRLPNIWTRPDGQRVAGYADGPPEMHERDGWRAVGDRPAVEWYQTAAVILDGDGVPVWAVTERPIEEIREERIAQLWQWHDARIAEGCPVTVDDADFRVDCDQDDVLNWISGERLLDISGVSPVTICDYHNTVRAISADGYRAMVLQIGAHVGGLMARRWALRQQIQAADTVAAMIAINFDEE